VGVVALAVAAGLFGALVVGPWLARAAQRWIGWRVVLPMLLGFVPPWSAVSPRQAGSVAIKPPYQRPLAAVTGLVFAVVGLRFGWSIGLLPVLVLLAGLVAVSAVDLVCWRIPARFVYLAGAGVVAGLVVAAVVGDVARSLVGAAVGAGVYLLVLGGLHLLSPRYMGFGDVRLGTLIGLVVGWMGWDTSYPVSGPLSLALFAMTIASLIASVAGAFVLILRRRARRLSDRPWREPYPFGPWLCVGALIAILAAAPGPV
jgi:leader peptidase (prepilin peptidase) / N-methyltransferase